MDFDKVLDSRHSTRSFKDYKTGKKDVFAVLEAALKAPMAANVCTLKFVLVDEKDKVSIVAESCPENEFIGKVSHLIVVCSNLKQAKSLFGEKAEHYAAQQAGAAIENMLLKIADLGLASCWIGGFDESAVKRILKIPGEYRVEAIIPIGKELKKPGKKRKSNLKGLVRFNDFEEKKVFEA